MQVQFYEEIEDQLLKFAVIISKYQNKWVFCKHKLRDTFEIPGGHREENENILETAKRELYEETGAIDFKIKPIVFILLLGKIELIILEKNFMECFIMRIYILLKKICIVKWRRLFYLMNSLIYGHILKYNQN